MLPGDFNGDRVTDVARIWNDLGRNSITVSLGVRWVGPRGKFSPPSDWSIRDGGWIHGKDVKWIAGDFSGDGRTDIGAAWNNGAPTH